MIINSKETRKKLKSSINDLTDVVTSTLGPGGKTVLIRDQNGLNWLTKDGVTVAHNIHSEDDLESAIYNIIKQASLRTVQQAGDGTTTSTLMANTAVQEALAILENTTNPRITPFYMKSLLRQISDDFCEELDKMSQDVDYTNRKVLEQVATISANGDIEMGRIIADVISDTKGLDGNVNVQTSKTPKSHYSVMEGIHVAGSFLSRYFINNPRGTCEFNSPNVKILLVNGKIDRAQEILPILNQIANNKSELVIFCEDMGGDCLSTIVNNTQNGVIRCCVFKFMSVSDREEILDDLSFLSGATVFGDKEGKMLDNATTQDLGVIKSIRIDSQKATLITDSTLHTQDERNEYIEKIKSVGESSLEADIRIRATKRAARLTGGIGIIYVGANTELELTEKRDRVDDAIYAVRSSLENGVIPGGGAAMQVASKKLLSKKYKNAENHVKRLITAIGNASINKVVANVWHENPPIDPTTIEFKRNQSYDVFDNDLSQKNMFKLGVIDPTKVVKCALTNGLSVAGTIITTDFAVVTKFNPQQEAYQ